jgi:hypothetical protein
MVRGIGDAEPDYIAFLAKQIVGAVVQARANAGPVRASWSSAPLKLGVNRRVPSADGKAVTMGQYASGPCDSQVRVLCLQGGTRPILLMQHACHPYCISPAQTLISPDFPGYAVRAMTHAGVDSLFINGCAGDIATLRASAGQAGAKEEGEKLASAALQAHASARPDSSARLWVGSTKVQLAYDTLPDSNQLQTIETLAGKPAPDEPSVKTRIRLAMQQWRTAFDNAVVRKPDSTLELKPQTAQVSLLRIADGALAILPGEPFFTIGQEIQTRINHSRVAVAGYGHGFCGYVPTPDAYSLGGYEIDLAHLYLNLWRTSPGSAARLVDSAVLLWNSSTKEIGS